MSTVIYSKDLTALRLLNRVITPSNIEIIKKQIGTEMVESIKLNIRRQVSPDGVPWARLKYRRGKALRLTDRMYNSMKIQIDGDNIKAGTDYGTLPDTTATIAMVHQYGTTIRPKRGIFLWFKIGGKLIRAKKVVIPARPFIGFSNSLKQRIENIVMKSIKT